jgi:uncharacterized protein (DUF433 family)
MEITFTASKPPLSVDKNGTIRVNHTRVTLRTLITAYKQGATPEQIVQEFTTLKLANVYQVLGYYLEHEAGIDLYLSEQEQRAADLRRQSDAAFHKTALYKRLMEAKQKPNGNPTTR